MGPTNTRAGRAGAAPTGKTRATRSSGGKKADARATGDGTRAPKRGAAARASTKTGTKTRATSGKGGTADGGRAGGAGDGGRAGGAGGKDGGRRRARPLGLDGDVRLSPFAGLIEPGGAPASRRALRNQGRRTMRKLLDAAMEAFDSRGYHATRVNDVVEIAKTSHGTFYLYFSNKEDLLRALVAEAAAEAAEVYTAMARPPAGENDWHHLREWVGRYSALWVHYSSLVRAWTDLAAIDPELGGQIRHSVRSMSAALARQIEAGGRAGDVDPDVAGMAVLAMIDRFHYLREFVGQPVDGAALDTLTTMVHRALFDGAPAAR